MSSFDAEYRRKLLTYAGLLMQKLDVLEHGTTGIERSTATKQAAARSVCEQWFNVMRELEKTRSDAHGVAQQSLPLLLNEPRSGLSLDRVFLSVQVPCITSRYSAESPNTSPNGGCPMTLKQANEELDFELRALAQTYPRGPAKQLRAPATSGTDGEAAIESTPAANSTEVAHAP
jgi:hypothetical protein